MIRLLLKKYDDGTYYLCKRESKDWNTYKGSGKNVKSRSINLVGTVVLGQFESKETFKKSALYWSDFFDVVNNPLFRNLKPEEGDGGDTLSGRKVYNNGERNRFFTTNETIPEGWVKGRYDKHNFTFEKQSVRGKKANHNTEKQRLANQRMGKSNLGKKHVRFSCLRCRKTLGKNNSTRHYNSCYDHIS